MAPSVLVERQLLTRDGRHVARIRMPDFQPPAEVVMWGNRVFVWSPASFSYYEGVCWYPPPDTFIKERT